MDVIELLDKLGLKTVGAGAYADIADWRGWYEGKTAFHEYRVYNGAQSIGQTRKSLRMAKKICEDKANLLINEKVDISTENAGFLNGVLDKNNFRVFGNRMIELAFALGTAAFVEYLEAGEIKIQYIPASQIFPLSWDSSSITECAFGSEIVRRGERITYINVHKKMPGGTYAISNYFFDEKGGAVIEPDIAEYWETGSEIPYFQIFSPNIINNANLNSPLGISVFANSIDVFEGIDLVYDSLCNEFKLGKKRIFVKDQMLKMNIESNGVMKPLFDPNDTVFYALPGENADDDKPIIESNMDLRIEEHVSALQSMLGMLSEKTGFGRKYFLIFSSAGASGTATEVVTKNSELRIHNTKLCFVLQDAIKFKVILYCVFCILNCSKVLVKY